MQVDMVFSRKSGVANGVFALEVFEAVGFPVPIQPLAVFADIDFEPEETPDVATIYVRMIDPDGKEVGRSEVRTRAVPRSSFNSHGRVALLTALPSSFANAGGYVVELIVNDKCVRAKSLEVGTR